MKTPAVKLSLTLSMIAAFSLTSLKAHAETLCGDVQRRIVKPQCNPDEMCAQYFRIAHLLVTPIDETELQTTDHDVLSQIVQSEGATICVEGERAAEFFNVHAIIATPVANN